MAGLITTTLPDGKVETISISNFTRSVNALQRFAKNHVVEGCVVTADVAADKVDVSAGAVIADNQFYIVGAVDALSLTTGSRDKTTVVYFDPTLNSGAGGVGSTVLAANSQPTLSGGKIALAYVTRVTADETTNIIEDSEIDNAARPRLFFPVKALA